MTEEKKEVFADVKTTKAKRVQLGHKEITPLLEGVYKAQEPPKNGVEVMALFGLCLNCLIRNAKETGHPIVLPGVGSFTPIETKTGDVRVKIKLGNKIKHSSIPTLIYGKDEAATDTKPEVETEKVEPEVEKETKLKEVNDPENILGSETEEVSENKNLEEEQKPEITDDELSAILDTGDPKEPEIL